MGPARIMGPHLNHGTHWRCACVCYLETPVNPPAKKSERPRSDPRCTGTVTFGAAVWSGGVAARETSRGWRRHGGVGALVLVGDWGWCRTQQGLADPACRVLGTQFCGCGLGTRDQQMPGQSPASGGGSLLPQTTTQNGFKRRYFLSAHFSEAPTARH